MAIKTTIKSKLKADKNDKRYQKRELSDDINIKKLF